MNFQELKIEYWPVEKLIPYARNPRKNDVHPYILSEKWKRKTFDEGR